MELEATSESAQMAAWLPALLQTADPLFPTGAYAHSFGLEELVRLDVVRNEASLANFLILQILPQLERQELPYLRFAHGAASQPNGLSALLAIDDEINAWKLAAEARSASIQIGTRRITALRTTTDHPLLVEFSEAVRTKKTHGHHLCACAIQNVIQNCPLEAALIVYGYQALAGACTAALKLIRIGQDGCQRALTQSIALLPATVRRSLEIERDEAGCFSPLLEIASMRHATAHERLFIS